MSPVVVLGVDRVLRNLSALAPDVRARVRRDVARASISGRRHVTDKMADDTGWDEFLGKPAGRGDTITTRTGGTRSRITPGGVVVETPGEIRSAVGSRDPHMKTLEDGGTAAKGSRVPLAKAQTRGGRDRLLGVKLTRAVAKTLGFFFYPTRRQRAKASRTYPRATYAVKPRSGGGLDFWYLFLDSARRIRPRHIFANASAKVGVEFGGAVSRSLAAATRKANG